MEIGKQFDDELIAAIDEANKFTVNQWRAGTEDWTGATKLMVKFVLEKDRDERKDAANKFYGISKDEELDEGSRELSRFHALIFSLNDEALQKIIASFPEMG